MAQRFNCSSSTSIGLRSCSYDSVIDAQCNVGPHVAGVRCTGSKSFNMGTAWPLVAATVILIFVDAWGNLG